MMTIGSLFSGVGGLDLAVKAVTDAPLGLPSTIAGYACVERVVDADRLAALRRGAA